MVVFSGEAECSVSRTVPAPRLLLVVVLTAAVGQLRLPLPSPPALARVEDTAAAAAAAATAGSTTVGDAVFGDERGSPPLLAETTIADAVPADACAVASVVNRLAGVIC